MSHLFRILLTIFILLLTAFVLMGVFAPKNYQVQRTKTIHASPNVVWAQLVNFKNWKNWSVWNEKDKNMQTTYSGKDGDIGAMMNWTGNDSVGTGSLTLKSISLNKEMTYEYSMKKPVALNALGTINLKNATDTSVVVTWIDYADLPFKLRPFMHFMNMDDWLGSDFERNLTKLDQVSSEIQAKLKN